MNPQQPLPNQQQTQTAAQTTAQDEKFEASLLSSAIDATVARKEAELRVTWKHADLFNRAGLFGDTQSQAQAAVKIMAGAELGLAPVQSMMSLNIIEGKISMSAALIAARIKQFGYDYRIKHLDEKSCLIEPLSQMDADGKRHVVGPEVVFTVEMAQRAKLLDRGKDPSNNNWRKYPEDMMFARCIGRIARRFFPEIMGGLPVYTPEEIDDSREPVEAMGEATGRRTAELRERLAEKEMAGVK